MFTMAYEEGVKTTGCSCSSLQIPGPVGPPKPPGPKLSVSLAAEEHVTLIPLSPASGCILFRFCWARRPVFRHMLLNLLPVSLGRNRRLLLYAVHNLGLHGRNLGPDGA